QQRLAPVLDVPLRAVVHGQAWIEIDERARVPRIGVAVLQDVCNPAFRNDLLCATRAAIQYELADAGQIARRHAHAARTARRAQAIDCDVRIFSGAHGLPDDLAHQIGEALARCPLDDPAEQVRV